MFCWRRKQKQRHCNKWSRDSATHFFFSFVNSTRFDEVLVFESRLQIYPIFHRDETINWWKKFIRFLSTISQIAWVYKMCHLFMCSVEIEREILKQEKEFILAFNSFGSVGTVSSVLMIMWFWNWNFFHEKPGGKMLCVRKNEF